MRQRILRFPQTRSLGRLVIVEPGYRAVPGDPSFVPGVEARGDITVPVGKEVRLHLRFHDAPCIDFSPLTGLEPDALDRLSIDSFRLPNSELRHLTHLTGLKSLSIRDTFTTDAGLIYLAQLTGLQLLHLDYLEITDTGIRHLRPLVNLRVLELMNTYVTAVGLAWLDTALPNCKVQHYPRRPPRYARTISRD